MTALGQPLKGVRVLSLAEQLPGPIATRLLGELGAEVIQLERPGTGDPQRTANPWLFRSAALGKKSVTLDLKRPAALAAAKRLASRADVLVEGYRPGVMKRLGLGYEDTKAANPRIVYCSISGYGQDGPARDLAGHNINYEALAGYIDPYVDLDSPYTYFPSGAPFGDLMAGAMAVTGILAGLRQAEREGVGAYLDLSITDALVFGLGHVFTHSLNDTAAGWAKREAGYGLFRTTDGMIALGIAHEDNFWDAMCRALGLEDLLGIKHSARMARAAELKPLLAEHFSKQPTQHWVDVLGRSNVPCSAVNRLADVPADPQIAHRELFQKALTETGETFLTSSSPLFRGRTSDEPPRVPALGAATEEVLRSLGYVDAELRAITGSDYA